jgi:hypothetical protein
MRQAQRVRMAVEQILRLLCLFRGRANETTLCPPSIQGRARRMAQQILRLPELVRIARGINPSEA